MERLTRQVDGVTCVRAKKVFIIVFTDRHMTRERSEQQRTLLSIGHSYGQQNRHINKKPRVLSLTFGFRADGDVVAITVVVVFINFITPLWAFRIATRGARKRRLECLRRSVCRLVGDAARRYDCVRSEFCGIAAQLGCRIVAY